MPGRVRPGQHVCYCKPRNRHMIRNATAGAVVVWLQRKSSAGLARGAADTPDFDRRQTKGFEKIPVGLG